MGYARGTCSPRPTVGGRARGAAGCGGGAVGSEVVGHGLRPGDVLTAANGGWACKVRVGVRVRVGIS